MGTKKTADSGKNNPQEEIQKEQEKARVLSEEANPKEIFYNVDGKAVDEDEFQQQPSKGENPAT